MKKLLLKLAYYILQKYDEKPVSAELGSVILLNGARFMVTDIVVNQGYDGHKLEVRARDVLEVLESGELK